MGGRRSSQYCLLRHSRTVPRRRRHRQENQGTRCTRNNTAPTAPSPTRERAWSRAPPLIRPYRYSNHRLFSSHASLATQLGWRSSTTLQNLHSTSTEDGSQQKKALDVSCDTKIADFLFWFGANPSGTGYLARAVDERIFNDSRG